MVKVEEVNKNHQVDGNVSSDSESDGEMPNVEGTHGAGRAKLNRAEAKARKAMQKIGMQPVEGIFRVTVRRNKNVIFAITKPEVMKCANSDTYVIFGEAKMEDLGAQAQASAAQQFTHTPEVAKFPTSLDVQQVEEADDGAPADDTGLEAKDIELVMTQVGCSRSKAVTALRQANGDLVEAIMQLSS